MKFQDKEQTRKNQFKTSIYAGFLFVILGITTWVTGEAFIFPSLGPTVFILAFNRKVDKNQVYQVIASHSVGGVVGFLSWHLIASGIKITQSQVAMSGDSLVIAVSATVSIILTTWLMIASGAVHPPACATTLIVSLGVLSTVESVVVIILSITIIVAIHIATLKTLKEVSDSSFSLSV